ncbi:MAG TPA: oligosaccharide flippase family protein [Haloplasmataceae bacterium]
MKKKWIRGTVILIVSSFIVKALSFFYKIPYQNIMGDVGFYVYQTVYPLFSVLALMSTYSIPLVTSELLIQGASLNALLKGFVRRFMPIGLMFFFFSPLVAKAFNDRAFTPFFILLSIVVLLTPFLGSYRGSLYCHEETIYKVGIANFIEQAVRVFFIGIALFLFIQGVVTDVYHVAFLSYGAFVLGLLMAFVYLLVTKKKGIETKEAEKTPFFAPSYRRMWILTLSASLLLLINLMDGLTMTRRLEPLVGFDEARRLKGVYDRSLPLIQGALFFVSPLITSYVPYLKKNGKPDRELVEMVLLFALPATVGLFLIYPQLHVLFFRDLVEMASLRLNLLMILLYSLVLSLFAVPCERMMADYVFTVIALGIKYAMNTVLIPHYRLIGAIFGNLSALFSLVFFLLARRWHILRLSHSNLIKILSSALVMGLVVWGIERTPLVYPLVLQVVIGIIVYFVLVWLLNPINIRQDIMAFFRKKGKGSA